MSNAELIQLIETSFLSDERKEELLGILRASGPVPAFFKQCNDFLGDEVSRRKDAYIATIRGFDEQTAVLQEYADRSKDALTKDLEKNLAGIGDLEFSKREKVWDAYYQAMEAIDAELDKKLKQAASQTVKTAAFTS